jgi:hypothetical protein
MLYLQQKPRRRAPKLPSDREWHPLTLAWWRDLWKSPMSVEFLESDRHGLFILAALVDQYWNDTSNVSLASEIRLQRACYGLSPIDRRRLQWQVERVAQVERTNVVRHHQENQDDPRGLLEGL